MWLRRDGCRLRRSLRLPALGGRLVNDAQTPFAERIDDSVMRDGIADLGECLPWQLSHRNESHGRLPHHSWLARPWVAESAALVGISSVRKLARCPGIRGHMAAGMLRRRMFARTQRMDNDEGPQFTD
jgi:hypothetical protein